MKPDVIVVPNQANAVAVREATHTIPIVAANFDPLGSGLAASFARPGGNVTGLSLIAPGSSANKWKCSRRLFRASLG